MEARYLKPISILIWWLLCVHETRAQQTFANFNGPQTICVGAPVTWTNLSATGSTYYWNFSYAYTDTLGHPGTGDNIAPSTGQTPLPYSYTIPGTYRVCLFVDSNATTHNSACQNISVVRAPAITLPKDTFFCDGTAVSLSGPTAAGVSNAWSTGATTNSITVNAPGNYTLQSQFYGCTASQTTTVAQFANPTLALPHDTVFCDSGVLKYTTNQPVTFIWNTGSNGDTAKVKTSGLYWLQLNERGCTALDSVICKVIPTDSLTLGKDTTFCGPGLLKYLSKDTVTYQWSTGSTQDSTAVPTTGNYKLAITDHGCRSNTSIQCTVIPKPQLWLPSDTLMCDSGALRNPSGLPVIYTWNTGAKTDTIEVKNSGQYTLTMDNAGCTTTGSTNVTVAQTPKIRLPADTTFCGPGQLTYASALPVTYSWNTGSTGKTTPVSTSGPYTLTLDNNGCTATATAQATVVPVPVVDLGKDTALCLVKGYVLDAGNPGDTYRWQDGSTAATYDVTAPGAYSVTVTGNGCSATANINIGSADVPYVSLGGNLSFCPGESVYLKPSPDSAGYTYSWQDGSTDSVYKVTAPGTYSITATNACTSYTATIQVQNGICAVHVPNAFTPNGDGKNDVFRVLGTEVVDQFSLLIYNRWGSTVYETTDKSAGWDGGMQPQGVYVYELHFRDALTGRQYMQNGTVILAR